MSATIIPMRPGMPWQAPMERRPPSVADLGPGKKALVIEAKPANLFTVSMAPANNSAERAVFRRFLSADAARRYARDTATATPHLYQLIIDKTGGAA